MGKAGTEGDEGERGDKGGKGKEGEKRGQEGRSEGEDNRWGKGGEEKERVEGLPCLSHFFNTFLTAVVPGRHYYVPIYYPTTPPELTAGPPLTQSAQLFLAGRRHVLS
jgi:hypothetical protein